MIRFNTGSMSTTARRLSFLSMVVSMTACTTPNIEGTEVAATAAGTAIATKAASATVEEQRVDDALLALGDKQHQITDKLRFSSLAGETNRIAGTVGRAALREKAASAGLALWAQATKNAQHAETTQLDDRPLYWQRLLEKREFRRQCNAPELCNEMLGVFERASRGATNLGFDPKADPRRLNIVISGFDPFGLDDHIDQSNPSGAAALALDGVKLTNNGIHAQIQSVLFPVRFADFDAGMVEDVFEPLITNNAIDMLITISMGRSDFDLERFPGRRRSASAPGNLRVRTGASPINPLIPLLAGAPIAGPEFVEFSLPVDALLRVQHPYAVNDNHTVTTLENGEHQAASLEVLNEQTAVRGSGGGYLSNEISYRAVRLVRMHNSTIAVGHIHTPRISAFDASAINAISNQIRAMLLEAIGQANKS